MASEMGPNPNNLRMPVELLSRSSVMHISRDGEISGSNLKVSSRKRVPCTREGSSRALSGGKEAIELEVHSERRKRWKERGSVVLGR